MKWNRYALKTLVKSEDLISAVLADTGICGIEIEDSEPLTEEELKGMFADIPPDVKEKSDEAVIYFYLDPDEDNESILESVKAEIEKLRKFADIGEGSIKCSQTEDKDWVNSWKKFFHRFYVDDILIIPSWEDVPKGDENKLILHIDPGTAFGTGMHETTRMCIKQLRKYVKPEYKLLDIGTGSGILSIIAVKSGASYALGTDLDPSVISAVADNKRSNDISDEKFELILGNIIDDEEVQKKAGLNKYDIVTANILAKVIIPLVPQAAKHLKNGGILIASGVLEAQKNDVCEAFADAGFELIETANMGEWVSITARKTS